MPWQRFFILRSRLLGNLFTRSSTKSECFFLFAPLNTAKLFLLFHISLRPGCHEPNWTNTIGVLSTSIIDLYSTKLEARLFPKNGIMNKVFSMSGHPPPSFYPSLAFPLHPSVKSPELLLRIKYPPMHSSTNTPRQREKAECCYQ